MKKPFSNAYEAIKKLFRQLFGIKQPETENGESGAEATDQKEDDSKDKLEETKEEEAKPEKAAEAEEPSETKQETKSESKSGSKQQSKKSDKKGSDKKGKDSDKAIEDVLASIAQEEGIKEEKVSKGELDEQRKYEQEVKKRAERAAKREAEDRKKEAAAAESEKEGNVKTAIDPVTGEEITLDEFPKEAKYLKKYMRIQTTSDDIAVAINSILKHPDMPKNIVILGRNGFGTVKVGEDFARSFYDMGLVTSEAIAKTKAKQLNKMSLDKLTKLKGGCLIIENAGLVSFDKLVEVIKDSAPENNNYVVILTGEIDSLANFFEENEDIVDSFIYLIDIHKIKERGMMHLARGYVKEKGYKADKSVFDKLKASLKTMEEGNIDRFITRIDEVIEKCDKREAAAGGEAPKVIKPEDAN
ncbi:MAG: hypothetical protein K6E10_04205 [Eubacterium sp.]|nr:hypothetical protein [Eubacterium sp.]